MSESSEIKKTLKQKEEPTHVEHRMHVAMRAHLFHAFDSIIQLENPTLDFKNQAYSALHVLMVMLSHKEEQTLVIQKDKHHKFHKDLERFILKRLINYGADVNARDSEGNSYIFYAAEKGRVNILKQLVKAGIQLTPKDLAKARTVAEKNGYKKASKYLKGLMKQQAQGNAIKPVAALITAFLIVGSLLSTQAKEKQTQMGDSKAFSVMAAKILGAKNRT